MSQQGERTKKSAQRTHDVEFRHILRCHIPWQLHHTVPIDSRESSRSATLGEANCISTRGWLDTAIDDSHRCFAHSLQRQRARFLFFFSSRKILPPLSLWHETTSSTLRNSKCFPHSESLGQ